MSALRPGLEGRSEGHGPVHEAGKAEGWAGSERVTVSSTPSWPRSWAPFQAGLLFESFFLDATITELTVFH